MEKYFCECRSSYVSIGIVYSNILMRSCENNPDIEQITRVELTSNEVFSKQVVYQLQSTAKTIFLLYYEQSFTL